MTFHVTYQIVTEESAEQGEAAESGFIDKLARQAPAFMPGKDSASAGADSMSA